jgi:hypothetical protein
VHILETVMIMFTFWSCRLYISIFEFFYNEYIFIIRENKNYCPKGHCRLPAPSVTTFSLCCDCSTALNSAAPSFHQHNHQHQLSCPLWKLYVPLDHHFPSCPSFLDLLSLGRVSIRETSHKTPFSNHLAIYLDTASFQFSQNYIFTFPQACLFITVYSSTLRFCC